MTPPLADDYPWLNDDNVALLQQSIKQLEQSTSPASKSIFFAEHQAPSWEQIMNCIKLSLDKQDQDLCRQIIEQLAESNTPLMLFSHQFGIMRNKLIRSSLESSDVESSLKLMDLLEEIEDSFAQIYLQVFLKRIKNRNYVRLSHIEQLKDKNLLSHFESHLVWMDRLIEAVSQRNPVLLPELCHERCSFGLWLKTEASELIRDRSHISQINQLHKTMHHVVFEVQKQLSKKHVGALLYSMLKKAEMYSLELGNEISLLNNIVIMSVYSKDPLTSLLSRRFLDRVLYGQMEVAKATEVPFSIIMFDLDHFKNINDSYGHATGDKVLVHVSNLVRNCLRKSDLIFRYGGEEFMIVCPSTGIEQARDLAEKLRQLIAQTPLLLDEQQIFVSASFGVTELVPHAYQVVDAQLVNEIIDSCDGRLYAAKRSGRNCVF